MEHPNHDIYILLQWYNHSHRSRGRCRDPRPRDIVPIRGTGSNRVDVPVVAGSQPRFRRDFRGDEMQMGSQGRLRTAYLNRARARGSSGEGLRSPCPSPSSAARRRRGRQRVPYNNTSYLIQVSSTINYLVLPVCTSCTSFLHTPAQLQAALGRGKGNTVEPDTNQLPTNPKNSDVAIAFGIAGRPQLMMKWKCT
uniref:Uncharacterized protein n=1 Tax=Arundo donax TaxID=35708 RepID=A0A0A9F408_ARUDO